MAVAERRAAVRPTGVSGPVHGAPRSTARRRGLTVVLWCFPALFALSATVTVVRVQDDLEGRATAALRRAGAVGVTVSFRGQDARVECGVPVADPRALAALVAAEHGVRSVRLADTCGGPRTVPTDVDASSAVDAPATSGTTP